MHPLDLQSHTTAGTRWTRAQFLRASALAAGWMGLRAAHAQSPEAPVAVPAEETFDLRDFVRWIGAELEPSVRRPGPAGSYTSRVGGAHAEVYGTADMACILFTIGALHPSETERAEWIRVLESFQDPRTGFFVEQDPTLPPLHNTAFALAALELFDYLARPPRILPEMASPRAYLSTLDFNERVYPDAHRGAALGAIYALTPSLGAPEWFREYFEFVDAVFEPSSGLIGRKNPGRREPDMIGGTFAYGFLYYAFNRQPPYTERRVDTLLAMQQPDGFWSPRNHFWLTLDALSLLVRGVRQAPQRISEVRSCAHRAMRALMGSIYSPEGRRRAAAGHQGVHNLTAAVTIAAELQEFLGADVVVTEDPLHFVLDRRPFI